MVKKLPVFLLLATPCFGQLPDAPKPTVKPSHKAEYLLFAAQTTLSTWDAKQTLDVSHKPGFVEKNPLARPFVRSSAVAYSVSAAEDLGCLWLARRWRRSTSWQRHIWWLPQVAGIAGHSIGLATSNYHGLRPKR